MRMEYTRHWSVFSLSLHISRKNQNTERPSEAKAKRKDDRFVKREAVNYRIVITTCEGSIRSRSGYILMITSLKVHNFPEKTQ